MSILSYKIANVRVTDFGCEKSCQADKRIGITTKFNFRMDVAEKRIMCESFYSYTQDNKIVLHLALNCIFQIESQSFESLRKNDKFVVPTDYLQYMATICVGTARGEIHSRAEMAQSEFQDVVLPPIDLTKIINTETVFNA